MKRATIPLLAVAMPIAACGQAPSAEANAEVLRAAMLPCLEQIQVQFVLLEAASARAHDAQYADQAKAGAVVCRGVREKLERDHPESACIPLIQAHEMLGWRLAASFEGRADFTRERSELSAISNEVMTACASELPPPPPETPEEKAAREQAVAESEAIRVEAEKAAVEAAQAAAEAQAMLEN